MEKEIVEERKYDLEIWKKTYKYLKVFNKQFIQIVFCMLFIASIDVAVPYMAKYAIDTFIIPGTISGLNQFIVIYIIMSLMLSVTIYVFISIAGKVELLIVHRLRDLSFNKLQKLSLSYFDKNATGWIMARTTSDIAKIGMSIAWGLVDFFWGMAMMIGIIIVMAIINLKLALITFSVIPVLIYVSIYFQKKILKEQRNVRRLNSKITSSFNEGIVGAKTSKTLVREEQNSIEFEELSNDMRETSIRAAIVNSLYLPIILFVASIGSVLALNFGGLNVISGAISFGTLVLFINYVIQFFEPVRELSRIFAEMLSAQAALERVLSLIEMDIDVVDSKESIKLYGTFSNPNDELARIKGDIIFENVEFEYNKGEAVLKTLNLKIQAGHTVALVGETGSGKSTIVNLACRFYEPTKGRIYIDGTDYKDLSTHYIHSNLGYVLQSPHLFSGSILDNIRYGRTQSSFEEVVEVCKLVNAHEFIENLENGYESEVGEGGSNLSTGQKQLLSFARAIIANPSIFILDEATSSIDTETEAKIQKAVEKVLDGRTSFVIAHRLSTIKNADRILVVESGVVVEDGTHDSLLKKRGKYYKLY
ncbi:MAG: ABC transporter ATP-binding protein, partial [Acidaminobacteraceae bacterium]